MYPAHVLHLLLTLVHPHLLASGGTAKPTVPAVLHILYCTTVAHHLLMLPFLLQFVHHRLSVDSTQRYVRDVLNQWAALQSFIPSLPATWDCLLTPPLSEMFGHEVSETHTWMKHVHFYNCTQ